MRLAAKMDPEALKRLQVELEELCQSHQAELHRCVANFAISLNNAEKRGQEGLLAVERVPQPPRLGRLEPLKPHSWTKLAGEKLTSNTATSKEMREDSPAEEVTSSTARWLSGCTPSPSFWLNGSMASEASSSPGRSGAQQESPAQTPVAAQQIAAPPAAPAPAELPAATPEVKPPTSVEVKPPTSAEVTPPAPASAAPLLEEPKEPTESTEPSLPHVPASETGNFPSEASSGSGLAGADGAGNPPRRIPRLQKLASSHGVAMRAAAIRNMQLAVKEAKDSKEAKEETQEEKPNVDFNCPEAMIVVESRASLSSNFSDAGRRTSMMSDQAADEGDGAASSSPGASGETQVDEDGDGHVAENRQGRRALVESKSLAALPPSVLKVAEDNGISQKHMRKSAFLASESRKRLTDSQTIWQRIVTSSTYESLSGAFILLNCGFVAWQTQAKAVDDEWRAETYQELTMAEPVLFNVIQGVFTIVFAVDLVFRILADRSFFVHYKNKEFLWNVMDSFVVTFDLVSIFLEVWVQFGLLRMMRVLRIVRVVKIIRVMKSFAELRMLMYSIVSCIKSLVWVIAVLVLNMGLFAVLFTSATGSELDTGEKRRDPKFEKLVSTFGTLDRSIIHLYMAMTGGTDWIEQYKAVWQLPVIYHGLFLIYITFGIYALANVITSIFLENARKSSKSDREHVIQEEMQSKTQYLRDIEMIFAEMDADGNGLISRQEFHETLKDERVVAYFRSMKLDAREAEHLFNLLDYDGSGEVSYPEFVDGCWKLQGEARSLDVKIIQLEVTALSKALKSVQDQMAGKAPDAAKLPSNDRPNRRVSIRSTLD